MNHALQQMILSLCAERGADKSICPTEAAQAFAKANAQDDLAWRGYLTDVRRNAVELAMQGSLLILRKGKPVDPQDFRGVYRLGLPRSD